MPRLALALLLAAASAWAGDQSDYGAKGIYPVYETAGQWAVFDKAPRRENNPLGMGNRFLVIGSAGARVFEVARASGTWGGACRDRHPVKLRAALLRGPRRLVGRPIIALRVPRNFSLNGSRAVYRALASQVGDAAYAALEGPIKQAAIADLKAGQFPLRPDDEQAQDITQNPAADKIQVKIDFGAPLTLRGLKEPFAFVEETQVSASTRRCLRLADEGKLIGGCARMRHELMAETDQLQFVSYDPSGQGSPFLLAFTKTAPLWGDERWGFVMSPAGPRPFLMDSMDPRCREGF